MAHPGWASLGQRVCECVQGSGLGRGQAVDSVEGFPEPEEGRRTETEAGGAEAGYRGSGEEEDAGMVAVEAAFA